MTMGNRIAVMSEGRLQQVGTPQELYDFPVNRFVAGFIGSPSMNFIEVTLGGAEGQMKLEAPGVSIPVPERFREMVRSAGRSLVAGIRPEHFEIGNLPEGSSASVSGVAEVVEYLGNEELLHVTTNNRDLVAIVDSSQRVQPGQNVTLRVPLEKVYLFDPESGLTLDTRRQTVAA
jgi:multiple sugar transport system ATP-binding protein